MSQEDFEVVRRLVESWNARGPEEAIGEFWTEDGEYHTPPDLPDRQVVRGREACITFFRDLTSVVGQMHLRIAELRPCDGEVLALLRMEIIGAGSGVDIWGEIGAIALVDGQKLKRLRAFFTWKEALEAAGLSE